MVNSLFLHTICICKIRWKTDQCFQIQPVEYLRIPGKQWYTFFGYTIGVRKTTNGYESFSFANHFTNADVNSIKDPTPDYVEISDLGDYIKISVVNEPIDTKGANCFDIDEKKEYNGAETISHFQAGTYKVFCPVIRISQGGEHLYTDDVSYLITNQVTSVAGAKVYIADYSRENPIGYYTIGFGDEEKVEALSSIIWNIPDSTPSVQPSTSPSPSNPAVNPTVPSTNNKSAQPMTVKTSKKTVKVKKLKKKKQVVGLITVKSAQGTLTYRITGGNKKSKKVLTINKANGKVTIKKGTKKGTYKVKVTVSASGNKQYKAGSKTVEVNIVVK